MTRDELIVTLEQAEVGSRELSDEVLLACGWRVKQPKDCGVLAQDGDCMGCGNKRGDKCVVPRSSWDWTPRERPDVTRSLDAALPGENIIHVVYRGFVPHPERIEQWEAAHAVIEDGKMIECLWGRAKTEPLARRIAALKVQP